MAFNNIPCSVEKYVPSLMQELDNTLNQLAGISTQVSDVCKVVSPVSANVENAVDSVDFMTYTETPALELVGKIRTAISDISQRLVAIRNNVRL